MDHTTLIRRFFELCDQLTVTLPDWITGRSDIMKQKYYKKYGTRDFSLLILRNKARTTAAYVCIAALFTILFFGCLMSQWAQNKEITSVTRPGNGQDVKPVPMEVQMSYRGAVLAKDINLKVGRKMRTSREKLALLEDFKASLGERILGENKDLNHITKPLSLMDRDPETGITIDWSSEDSEVVSDSGEVNLIKAAGKGTVKLKADLALDDAVSSAVYRLKIDPNAQEEDYQRSLELALKDSLNEIAKDTFLDRIVLPDELDGGVKVKWFSGKEKNSALLVPAFLFMILVVYFRRYDKIDREIREAELSVNRDLPEFINKLVLLLNAGLVFSSAFSKIVKDYNTFYSYERAEHSKKKFLYEEFAEIQKRVDQSNTSLMRELKEFAQRCGVREMVRLTAVISDNWNKGSTLAEKLEAESDLMWISRKKRAEEKGKLAETKLTFPLMILLLVLILITIAPAMLEM